MDKRLDHFYVEKSILHAFQQFMYGHFNYNHSFMKGSDGKPSLETIKLLWQVLTVLTREFSTNEARILMKFRESIREGKKSVEILTKSMGVFPRKVRKATFVTPKNEHLAFMFLIDFDDGELVKIVVPTILDKEYSGTSLNQVKVYASKQYPDFFIKFLLYQVELSWEKVFDEPDKEVNSISREPFLVKMNQ